MQTDTRNDAEDIKEQAKAWVRDNHDASEKARNELYRILETGPVNPAALGDFRKAHAIPKPIGGWLSLFDDVERVSQKESRNGQPAVGLKARMPDPAYWRNYRSCIAPSASTEVPSDESSEEGTQPVESVTSWVKDNKAISDIAHNHLRRILKDGPIHPAGLGVFRKKYEIPKLSAWLALFDDIVQLSMRESRNGQPVVGLKAQMDNAEYWRDYRTVCSLDGDVPQMIDSSVGKLEWRLLGLNGEGPGEIRAEIFRAFVLSNYGKAGADMVQVCGKFVNDSRMSFREFFGGLSARDVSMKEWGSLYCLWIPTSLTEMKVVPVGTDENCTFEQLTKVSFADLICNARSKVPERIDFAKLSKKYDVTRESVLAAYVLALGKASVLSGSNGSGAKDETRPSRPKRTSWVRSALDWMASLFTRRHERYLNKWEHLLLSRNDQAGEFHLNDGRVVKGLLLDAEGGYYTVKTEEGTEIVDRSTIKVIKAKNRSKNPSQVRSVASGALGYEGNGRIKVWRPDKQIGFIDDSVRTYFFHRGLVGVKELLPQLDSGEIWQTVRFVVVTEANVHGKYPCVKVTGVLGKGMSDYLRGKHALKIGDFETARTCFQKELDNPDGTSRLNALKDLSELIFRTDMDPNAAIALIERYRSDFRTESIQSSFDKMKVGYLQRANRYSDAESLIDKILQSRTLPAKLREYYEEVKRRIHSAILDSTGELLFEDLLISRRCDFHGLEKEGIARYEDLPGEEDGDKDSALVRLREKFKEDWDRFCEAVPIGERKLYRNRDFSEEQLRYQLTDFCLFKVSGDDVAADYSLRFYFWRKAQCLLYEGGEASRREAFAYLILTARLMAPSRYWHTVLPLVISYAAMGADAEELRRIVEDEEYRNSALSEVPIDGESGNKIKGIVERFELNKILPEFDGIFDKLGLSLDSGRGEYGHLLEMVLKKIGESSELLSRECLVNIRSFAADMPELEAGDCQRRKMLLDVLEKALDYISTQGYEERSRVQDDLRSLLVRFEDSFLLSNLSLTAIDVYYPVVHSVCDAVASDFSHMAESISDEEFVEISNPYLRYEHNPAAGKLFVGRETKLDEIAKLFDDDVGGQCYILYGQRRSGKTSMLNNLEKRLGDDRFVYSKINAGILTGDGRGGFLGSFTLALEAEISSTLSTSAVMPPDSSSENFLGRLRFMSRYVQGAMAAERRRWVVGIDEFTYLYNYYLEDRDGHREAVRDFLRAIKALLEAQLFHLILIGQESVVQMQRLFPNEFAIWRPNRLSYLGENDVRQLVDAPIAKLRDNGDRVSRYRGDAFADLFRLTAGQPWFTQRFCSRMVAYLNANKISDITGSVVFAVAQSFCEGDDKLSDEEFEPFVNLMDPDIDEAKVIELYYRIAQATVNYSDWLPLDEVRSENGKEMALLEKRGIVVVKNGGARLRMGLFAMWLRANPGRTRESFGGKTA